MAIDYNLMCDMCGVVIDGSLVSSAEVRRVAKLAGNAYRYKGEDLCSRCYPKVRDAEKAEAA